MADPTPEALNLMLAEHWPKSNVTCVAVSATAATARLNATAADLRPGGFLSGPSQFGVADAAFWFLVSGALGRVEPMALTSELSIRFLRPATGASLTAEATLDRIGRTQAVGTVRVWTDDAARPCSVAQGTYTVGPPRP